MNPVYETLNQDSIAEARERFYPDWWMFGGEGSGSVDGQRPAYTVVVRTEDERNLAYRVKPASVDARIVLHG
jgi:hypothetical protein